jgi:hypothetical protein
VGSNLRTWINPSLRIWRQAPKRSLDVDPNCGADGSQTRSNGPETGSGASAHAEARQYHTSRVPQVCLTGMQTRDVHRVSVSLADTAAVCIKCILTRSDAVVSGETVEQTNDRKRTFFAWEAHVAARTTRRRSGAAKPYEDGDLRGDETNGLRANTSAR